MRKLTRFVVVFTILSLVVVGVVPFAAAQDTAPAVGTVQCDQDLILNLYIADRFFGFGSVRDQLMASGADASTMVDLNLINKGQYQPWFDSSMAMSASGTEMTTGLGLNDQHTSTVTSTLMLDDASRQALMDSAAMSSGVDTTTLTQLPAPSITGEAPECTQLRSELNRFFSTVAFSDFSGAFSSMTGTGTTDTGTTGTTDMSGATATPAA
ncbi:MAG: hypothetical protein K8I30_20290 [Anaerolineae bacterium]|nr:hypothetical protein [Anaerolineae bacterium]